MPTEINADSSTPTEGVGVAVFKKKRKTSGDAASIERIGRARSEMLRSLCAWEPGLAALLARELHERSSDAESADGADDSDEPAQPTPKPPTCEAIRGFLRDAPSLGPLDKLARLEALGIATSRLVAFAAPLGDGAEPREMALSAQRTLARERDELVMRAMRMLTPFAELWGHEAFCGESVLHEGALALIECIDRFDPEKGNFQKFAWLTCRARIQRAHSVQALAMRLPAHHHDKVFSCIPTERRHAQDSFLEGYDLSKTTGLEASIRYGILTATSRPLPIPRDQSDQPPADVEEPLRSADVADAAIERRCALQALTILGRTRPALRSVIEKRFGLNGEDVATLEEIGAERGVTRERVRQIEADGLRLLRVIFESPALAATSPDEPRAGDDAPS